MLKATCLIWTLLQLVSKLFNNNNKKIDFWIEIASLSGGLCLKLVLTLQILSAPANTQNFTSHSHAKYPVC